MIDLAAARETFEASQDLTVGIEEEYALVHPETLELIPKFEELRVAGTTDPVLVDAISGELISSEIEIRSGRGEDIADARAKQQEARRRLFALAEAHDVRLGTTGTHRAADVRHAPDSLLVCHEHKAVSVREAIGGLEVIGIALDEVGLAIPLLVPQQGQIAGPLFCDDDIVVGKNEQSTRMLQARDERRGGEILHHARHLSRIWDDQRSACRDWIALSRR